MQRFLEIAEDVVNLYCENFHNIETTILVELESSSETRLVKGLQALNWQKAIIVIGLFSLFESNMQHFFSTEKNTLTQILDTLKQSNHNHQILIENFEYYKDAINVLKHGKGRSYDNLIKNINSLPFIVTLPDSNYRNEGDVSEISTLVQVDEEFLIGLLAILKNCYQILK